jgi:hypothetical protein
VGGGGPPPRGSFVILAQLIGAGARVTGCRCGSQPAATPDRIATRTTPLTSGDTDRSRPADPRTLRDPGRRRAPRRGDERGERPSRDYTAGALGRRTCERSLSRWPRRARLDQAPAPRAGDLAGSDERLPARAQSLVIRPVTPCDRLIRCHRASTIKTGRETRLRGSRARIALADHLPPSGAMRVGGVFLRKGGSGFGLGCVRTTPPRGLPQPLEFTQKEGQCYTVEWPHGCRCESLASDFADVGRST